MAFGQPVVLCGAGKLCGYQQLKEHALVKVARGFLPTSNQEFGHTDTRHLALKFSPKLGRLLYGLREKMEIERLP